MEVLAHVRNQADGLTIKQLPRSDTSPRGSQPERAGHNYSGDVVQRRDSPSNV